MLLFPSLFLSLTVLAFIMLGDAIREPSARRAGRRAMATKTNGKAFAPGWTEDDGHLLDVRNLNVEFRTRDGRQGDHGASFHLDRGESLAILGESAGVGDRAGDHGHPDSPPDSSPVAEVCSAGSTCYACRRISAARCAAAGSR